MTIGTATTNLYVGARLLSDTGYLVIRELGRFSLTAENSLGETIEVPHSDVSGVLVDAGEAEPFMASLEPWWSGLPSSARREASDRLETVFEVLEGYRWGSPRFAQPGEPFPPFGDQSVPIRRRCMKMAQLLTYERGTDRARIRRLYDGEIANSSVSSETVYRWVRAWRKEGLRGLVDKRSTRGRQGFDVLDERVRRIADDIFEEFDGDRSRVNTASVEAAIRVRMKQEGISGAHLPERLFQEFLSERQRALGRTTRSHRTRSIHRRAAANTSYAAMHPGHLALDATRVDNLVWDELHQRPVSVEVLTLISVATRVVVALRVTPRSGNAVEAGLTLYDAMRPMSLLVEGTTIDDWRWCGVPESLDLSEVAVHRSRKRIILPGNSLQGVHHKPGIRPSSIRCDHGSVFLSEHFIGLCRDFGIDLMLSRGKKPTDNPHVERWHETLQRAYQAIPGFKGRNVAERGRTVHNAEPLLTAAELERHLHRFVALDYHRSWHEGLVLPGAPSARLTPLEMWDAMMDVTGRLHVPQHPDLIYQFLPIRWLTVGHAGVEYKNLVYDAPVLNDFRNVRIGTFKHDSRQTPFHYDPRDVSRIWFRHPETGRIHEIGWKARHLLDVPMGEVILDRALRNIAARNAHLTRKSTWRQIIDELGQLTDSEQTIEARNQAYAARLRWEQAQRDHDDAAEARRLAGEDPPPGAPRRIAEDESAPAAGDDDGLDWDAPLPDYREGTVDGRPGVA